MELTNATRKLIRSLSDGRHRRQSGLFVAEGTKCVVDTVGAFRPVAIFATADWIAANGDRCGDVAVTHATKADIERMTQLTTPPQVIAVYRLPEPGALPDLSGKLTVALDRIQDPGNLGTIIRVCDWMGVTDILASNDTVDVYNPKVVQATMGSIARVRVHYTDLATALQAQAAAGAKVYGTLLDEHAQNIYTASLDPNSILVMGNEGRGISAPVRAVLTDTLFIPPYPAGRSTAESLNVAVATSIALAEFRRREF